MPTFSLTDFRAGLDLRKPANVSEAGRLQRLVNCYSTTGGFIRKRPAFRYVATLPAGCSGIKAHDNQLFSFVNNTFAGVMPDEVQALALNTTDGVQVQDVTTFLGNLYVAAKLDSAGTFRHFYASADPAPIGRTWGTMLARQGAKMFTAGPPYSGTAAVDPALSSVAFSKTNNPTDWTAVSDAGFLPTDTNAFGSKTVVGLAAYYKDLAVFLPDSVQIWGVDPDPTKMALKQSIQTSGLWAHASIANLNGEVLYLSRSGFRSLSVTGFQENLAEFDVGTPVDSLVVPLLLSRVLYGPAVFYSPLGQYICFGSNMAMVLTIAKSSKLSAWSYYALPFTAQYATLAADGSLYVLDDQNRLYVMDRDGGTFTDTTDAGEAPIVCEIETSFIDFQKPNNVKQIHAIDLVLQGSAQVALRFDPNEDFQMTPYIDVAGDTRVGGVVPVCVMSTGLGVSIRHALPQAFELRGLGIQFDDLGVM